MNTPIRSLVLSLIVVLVTACGGGGTTTTPTPLIANFTVTSTEIKILSFNWDSFSGSSYYKLLVNPDGASGFTQEGSNVSSTSISVVVPVHLADWINASYMLEAYDVSNNKIASSSAVSITSLMLSSIGYFKASNTGVTDNFGFSISLSDDGKVMAVGARKEDSSSSGINSTANELSKDSGAVYVFHLNGSTWVQISYIKASNPSNEDWFGDEVSLSGDGNTLAVGAILENSNTTGINSTPNDSGSDVGAVYLYRFDGGNWSQEAYLKPSNSSNFDNFGGGISLSDDGNILAVGAGGEDSSTTGVNTTPNELSSASGAVYIFNYDGSNWFESDYIKPLNNGAGDRFGNSVHLSGDGNTFAVKATGEDSSTTGVNSTPDNLISGSGATYIFRYDGSSWSEEAYIKASNPGANELFGTSISLSDDGNILAVGAIYENSTSEGINSIPNDDGYQNGAVYTFRFDGSNWYQDAYIKSSNTLGQDHFGSNVSLSDDGVILAVNSSFRQEAVYFFQYEGGNWTERNVINSNEVPNDKYGWSISLSGDGNTFAVGAIYEDSSTNGINSTPDDSASNSGAVYLY